MQLLKPAWVVCDGRALMSIDIHPDGDRFAVGGQGVDCGRVSIWNMKPILDTSVARDKSVPKLLTQMDHHEGCVNCVRWSNDGKFLASAGDDKLIMIWEKSAYGGGAIFGSGGKVHVETWRLRHTLRGHGGDVLHVAWSPFDNILASASVDNTVMIWNAESFPEIVTTLKGHTGLVKGVVFDPVGKYLASQSDDKTLRIWRTSDWTQETMLEKPFSETGATTHVLRPDWSPDGALLVSAHAMNGGGPTAQIIERSGWKIQRDFVGHRKAVSCVRFNKAIFEKSGSSGKVESYATVALGSRDRSISVWSTNLKRPFFVINDIFEQSVLDLSWSKDGRVLLACSMDGSMAAVVLNTNEIGRPLSDQKLHELMTQVFGKSFGKTAIMTKSKQNGTVVIENPDMLKASSKYSNGHAASPASAAKTRLYLKGPTDKQIEARTSDGRRRITPIFVPPPAIENGAAVAVSSVPFGSAEFGSSSTQEKSQIAIEKRDDIVTPNISPGKPHSNDSCNSLMAQRCPRNDSTKMTSSSLEQEPKPVKPASETAKPIEPTVNLIQVKRKPGPAAPAPTTVLAPKPAQKEVEKEKESKTSPLTFKKKRSGRVILDSSDDDDEDKEKESSSSSSGSGSSSSSSSEDEGESEVNEKNIVENDRRGPPGPSGAEKAGEKLKDSKLKKPELMLKRKAAVDDDKETDDRPQQPRKRIRPLLQRDISVEVSLATSALPEMMPTAAHPAQSRRLLPALKLDKTLMHNFTVGQFRATINVTNYVTTFGAGCSLHKIKCNLHGSSSWECLLSSPVCAVSNGIDFLVAACQDGSLHIFSSLKGEKIFPPFVLDSGISKLTVNQSKAAVVTTDGRLYAWDLLLGKSLMRSESISALLTPPDYSPQISVNISKLNFSETGQLVVVTSAGKSYIFNEMLSIWLRMADTGSSVQNVSDYATSSANLPSETKGLPLASLSYLTPISAPKIQNVPQDLRVAASVTHCQDQILSAKYLGSPTEFKFWLMSEIKQLGKEGNAQKLRSQFESLLGPISSGSSSQWEPKIMGHDKRELLRSALSIIGNNLELQRLYSEFNEQLNATNDLKEVDDMLEI